MTTPAQLIKRYPYMFNGPNIGISIPAGWTEIFARLCADIDSLLGEDKKGFHFFQAKEKFGAARWYWHMDGGNSSVRITQIDTDGRQIELANDDDNALSSIQAKIGTLIHDAEAKTHHTCICCGAPGELISDTGYVLVLCENHAKVHRGGGELPFWFSEEDEIPVIFLDFDGVTHPTPCFQENHFCRLPNLELVLREFPQVPLVISSTWRQKYSLDEMKDMFSPDIAARIIGKTPLLRNKKNPSIVNCEGEPPTWERQWEIESWLTKNRVFGAPWIAIDDQPDMFKTECSNLLSTDPAKGFWPSDQERLRAMIKERLP